MIDLDLTVAEMLEILEAELHHGSEEILRESVRLCMDSRQVDSSAIFWPLVGENFDAHDFIKDVIKQGALMSIVEQSKAQNLPLCAYVPVDNSTTALLKLARGWQRRFGAKKIAITGSNGKTTTKDMVNAILQKTMNTIATQGNFNNQIGVPRTLFQINHQTEVAIVEMGTNSPGEIRTLSRTLEPHIA
ncbi:MAG: UDP-N-acetylmuramoyl-tripeptide--D-alanyl-D-alanine ligase, partial [Fibrobacter sp.]|nr:UDP-N-acetylmuramoyl-tripeptide--D-alanyl-D-alanine ligase [Fibrobacter sp.]